MYTFNLVIARLTVSDPYQYMGLIQLFASLYAHKTYILYERTLYTLNTLLFLALILTRDAIKRFTKRSSGVIFIAYDSLLHARSAMEVEMNVRKGEDHPFAKLRNHEVEAIRSLYMLGFSQEFLSRHFRVTQQNISLICVRITWKHI